MSEQETAEDAVTFLENAQFVYPDVSHILTKTQLLALDMSPSEPFTQGLENDEFVKLADAYFTSKQSGTLVKSELRVALIEPRTAGKPLDIRRKEKIVECLEMVSGRREEWTRLEELGGR